MSAAPARLAGLDGRKGAIAPGYDADLVIVDPDREMIVDASRLYHRHAVTPYDGARLRGVVMATMLRRRDRVRSRRMPSGRATGRLNC